MQRKGNIKRQREKTIFILLAAVALISCLFVAYGMADDHGKNKNRFMHEDHHSLRFFSDDDEGNETAGQIAAWLLLVANIPVAFSLLAKFIAKFVPLGEKFGDGLKTLNRFQKKYLMILHYYLNLVVLVIVTWHWVSSRCKSTALPELGFIAMVIVISFGVLLKFKGCPRQLRKSIYNIHTQPIIFLFLIMVLTIGHLIVD